MDGWQLREAFASPILCKLYKRPSDYTRKMHDHLRPLKSLAVHDRVPPRIMETLKITPRTVTACEGRAMGLLESGE